MISGSAAAAARNNVYDRDMHHVTLVPRHQEVDIRTGNLYALGLSQ